MLLAAALCLSLGACGQAPEAETKMPAEETKGSLEAAETTAAVQEAEELSHEDRILMSVDYSIIQQYLDLYEKYGMDYLYVDSKTEEVYKGHQALCYVYELLKTMDPVDQMLEEGLIEAPYNVDRQELISRFQPLPGEKLVWIDEERTLKNGETRQSSTEFFFDNQGRNISTMGLEELSYLGFSGDNDMRMKYDEEGRISEFYADGPYPIQAIPQYDEQGRIAAVKIDKDGEQLEDSFTYDTEGKLVSAQILETRDRDFGALSYTYDEVGNLIKMNWDCEMALRYLEAVHTYDAEGRRETSHVVYRNMLGDHIYNCSYEYDDQNRLSRMTVEAESEEDFTKLVRNYIYSQVCLYQGK